MLSLCRTGGIKRGVRAEGCRGSAEPGSFVGAASCTCPPAGSCSPPIASPSRVTCSAGFQTLLPCPAGDNFYHHGLNGTSDPLFDRSFKHVYTAPSLKDVPWHAVLGNHGEGAPAQCG